MGIQQTFLGLSAIGGVWIMYLLFGLSILSIAIIFERFFYFQANRLMPESQKIELQKGISKGKVVDTVRSLPSSFPDARMVKSALNEWPLSLEIIEQKFVAGLIIEQKQFEKRLLFLGTLGNNAPFIGLLGTVLGIIKAFYDISIAGSGGPSVVMMGIAEALITTAFGLFVAIPAVIAYNYFQRRARQIKQQMEQVALTLLIFLKKPE
ncbi:MAG: MotA/TolQ/ExbB proton channel family protein [Nitrospirae bacterium]|nr:MotA/TolQ/ExbB proton channel family protein [Nitrospirota bacterium]